MQCEYFSLEGLSQLVSTAGLIQGALNPKLELEGILLTMFDSRNNLAHQVLDEVKRHFGEKLFHSVIPRNVKLSEAPSHGKPVLLYDIESKGAKAYLEVTKEMIERNLQKTRPAVAAAVPAPVAAPVVTQTEPVIEAPVLAVAEPVTEVFAESPVEQDSTTLAQVEEQVAVEASSPVEVEEMVAAEATVTGAEVFAEPLDSDLSASEDLAAGELTGEALVHEAVAEDALGDAAIAIDVNTLGAKIAEISAEEINAEIAGDAGIAALETIAETLPEVALAETAGADGAP
jgi:hypothetical protein